MKSAKMEILTPNGWQLFDGVSERVKDSAVVCTTSGELIASLDHRFIISGEEKRCEDLKPNDMLSEGNLVISVTPIGPQKVYDVVNVANGAVFFHDGDVVSHNCEFLGSSKTLLTGETLRALAYRNPDFQHAKGEYKGLKIYEKPDVDRKYVMTVDVSRGRHLDSSAFGIFDVTEYPHKIVATYNNADIAPLMYSAICYNMAKKYNDAYILVEINDIGGQVAEEIYYTYEYGEMFWTKTGDVLGKQGADDYPGIRTTKKTKRIGCANLKDIIEKKQLIVDDWQMIQELATFVQSDSGNWEADEGFRDDSVAVLWLFAWLVMQPWFSDLTDKDIRSRMYSDKVREMEDELMPPTIITSQDWINEESPEYLGLRELL